MTAPVLILLNSTPESARTRDGLDTFLSALTLGTPCQLLVMAPARPLLTDAAPATLRERLSQCLALAPASAVRAVTDTTAPGTRIAETDMTPAEARECVHTARVLLRF